jgi:uncharacterized protein (DUF2384 family)
LGAGERKAREPQGRYRLVVLADEEQTTNNIVSSQTDFSRSLTVPTLLAEETLRVTLSKKSSQIKRSCVPSRTDHRKKKTE